MLKRIFKATRTTAVALMVLSIMSPVQVAEASTTISKVVTVLGPDGNPYVGAQVALQYTDVSTGTEIGTWTQPPATTDGSGRATLSFSDSIANGSLIIQPPATDTRTSIFMDYSTNYASSSAVTITLKAAALAISPLKWNGDAAVAGGGVSNGYKWYAQFIRTGAVGIEIPTTAPENTCTPFYLMASDLSYDNFRRVFATKITGTGSSRQVKLYSDNGTCLNEVTKINGVYQTSLNKGNVSGSLKTNAGGALTMPSGKGYSVSLEGVNSDGSANYGMAYAFAYLQSNGAFNVALETVTAGKYHISFGGFGDVNYPSFDGGSIYVTSDKKLSWNADGSSPATSLTKDFNMPLKNFSIGIYDSGTSAYISTYLNIQKQVGSSSVYSTYANSSSSASALGAYLTDGNYRIEASGSNSYASIMLSVSGSTITVTSATGKAFTRSGNDFTLWQSAPNAKIKVEDASGNPIQAQIDFCGSQCFSGSTNSSGVASIFVEDGTYGSINVNPTGNLNVGARRFTGSVTSGVVSITGLTKNSNNEWVVVLPASNFKYKVLNERTGTRLSGYVQVFTANSNWSKSNYYGQAPFGSTGEGGAYLADGKYIAEVNAFSGVAENDGLAMRQYRIEVANSGASITVSYNGNNVVASGGFFTVYPSPANLDMTIKDASGNLITSGNAEIWSLNSSGNRVSQLGWVNITSSGHIFASVPNGATSITVRPAASYTNAVLKTYTIATTNDVPVVNGGTLTNNSWVVAIPTPNIRVVVKNATTNTPLANAWVTVSTANDSWNDTGWLYNLDINPDNNGLARAHLANGKYLFTVNPSDTLANAGLASQIYRVAVTDSGTAVTLGSTDIAAVDGVYPLNPASSNFEIIVKKSDGTIFTNGWVSFCKTDSNGKSTNCNGVWLRSDGTQSRYLTDGTWDVVVVPASGQSDVTEKRYKVTVTAGVPAVTGLTIGGDGKWTLNPGSPNVSGTYTTSAGTLTFANDEGISLQVQKRDAYGNWQWQNGGIWSNSSSWALNLSGAGRYRLVANPYNFDDLVQSFSADIWVDGSNKLSLTETGTATDSITALAILMKTPNLKLNVVNPLNNDAPVAGGWVEVHKVVGNGRNWIGNADINVTNPGITGYNLPEVGNYILKVNPPQGDYAIAGVASKEYQVAVTALDSVTVSSNGVPVPVVNGRAVLRLASSNVTARILRTDGTVASNTNGRWYYVNVQKLNQWNNWDWINKGSGVDSNGYVSFRVDSAGKYRLRIEPYGDPLASVTYSTVFTVGDNIDTFEKAFGNISLTPPSIRVSVAAPGAPGTILNDVNIEVRKDGNWIDWAYTGQIGIAGISLAAEGNYELVPNPTGALQGTTSRKSYKFTATKNSDGLIVATPVAADGASTDSNGVVKLLLGLPTLSGTVKDPTGTTLQANSQVWAQNVANGQDLWEYSTNTNQNGAWAMSLPAGTYRIYANAPWGTSEYGKSNPVGNVVVDSSGVATSVPATYAANNFVIKLKAPTWSGTIKDPTGTTLIPQGRVCLLVSNNWNCTNADSVGHWALSMSDSFTSFTGTNPVLDISDDYGRAYPMRRVQGETNVSNALGTIGSTNVELLLQAPNVQITVTTPDSTKVASNLWVVAERDGVGYLGSGTTDATGLAKLNIPDPTLAFKIRVDVNGNSDISQNFAPLMQSFGSDSVTAGTTNGVFRATVQLPTPNFKFIVREPNDAGAPIPYTWVELLSGNDGPWLGGASTDANGFAHFKLDVPTSGLVNNFTVTVNPAWNATSNFTRQAYAVAVNSSGAITVVNKTSIARVDTQTVSSRAVYPLLLGIPSVTGVVVDPSNNGVANSWVVPIANEADNKQYLWQQGVNSRQNGQLAMNLAAGNYKLEANVPWGTSGLAKSAKCAVTVANGTISTGGDCVQSGTPNTVKLQLRLPNVKFTLKIGNTPIANANVSVGAGSWWTNAQSNEQGVVSLYIDAAAIREANPGNTGSHRLYFWIDPPYGSSTMARWSCASTDNKPLCKDLPDVAATGDYVGNTDPSWVVQGVQPNTRLKIVAPGTTNDLANSWVSVFAMNSSGYMWWLNGGNSGNDGYVAINIETATAFSNGYNKLVVEVQAPWNDRTRYAAQTYTNNSLGYTFESLTAVTNFSPALPNLKLLIKASNNSDNRYGWFGIQEVDGSNNVTKWVGGYGLDDYGSGSVYLAANKRYKLLAFPGGGRPGVQTSCILTTNSATPVVVTVVSCEGTNSLASTTLTLRLAGGNVVGTVLGPDGLPLVGAVVYANQPGAPSEATALITVTDESGHYDLQLTAGQQWTIKVFPLPTDSGTLPTKSLATPFTGPNQGTIVTKDFSYVAS